MLDGEYLDDYHEDDDQLLDIDDNIYDEDLRPFLNSLEQDNY